MKNNGNKKRQKNNLLTFLRNIIILKAPVFFAEKNQVHYISGPETLPPPLSVEEENNLVSKLGTDDKTDAEIRNTLVERNLRLVVYIAKRFENTKIGIEDLISIGTIGLMKSISTFRADKNIKLATYASRCIENEILMFIRKTAPLKAEVSLDEPLNVDWDGNELLLSDILGTDSDEVHKGIEEQEEKKCIYSAVKKLPERDRKIICMRFGFFTKGREMTQKEVADVLGISQSYISRLEKKIISNLKTEISSFYK